MYIILLCFILIAFIYVYFKYSIENFDNGSVSNDMTQIQNMINAQVNQACPPATFSQNGNSYCIQTNGYGSGCQTFPTGGSFQPWMGAYSVFGGFLTQLQPQNMTQCAQAYADTLSQWGLCNEDNLNIIKGYGYAENQYIITAIENACNFYKQQTG